MFPRQRRDILCIERIFPLPKPIRERLVDLYCHEKGRESAKDNAANRDCLVRPLLGRIRQGSASRLNIFSLRNFKLHLDQIKDLGLEAHDLAYAMADALAVLHWHTKIDAMDIEFALGSSPRDDQNDRRRIPLQKLVNTNMPTSTFEHVTNSNPNFAKRVTSLWLLDFDACADITMDQAGVNMACKAFVETDAYFPRPQSLENFAKQLWNSFGNRYIATAQKILDESHKDLPVKFLNGVTKLLDRQSVPRPPVVPAVYQSREDQVNVHTEGRFGGRRQSSSPSNPGAYVPGGSMRGTTSSGLGSPANAKYGGMDRHRRSRGGNRGGNRGAGSRGRGDGRCGSGAFAGGHWRG